MEMDESAAAAPAGAASGRTLKLSGIHASGVPDMDSTTPGKAQHADPYVVFQVLVGGQVFSAARTKHLLNAANPAWDDTLELPLPEPADPAAPPPLVLRIRLMDKDFSTADDPIAHAAVELRGVRGPVDVMAERRRGQGPVMAVPIGFRFALERDGLPEEQAAATSVQVRSSMQPDSSMAARPEATLEPDSSTAPRTQVSQEADRDSASRREAAALCIQAHRSRWMVQRTLQSLHTVVATVLILALTLPLPLTLTLTLTLTVTLTLT